jgi:hypothetical protein
MMETMNGWEMQLGYIHNHVRQLKGDNDVLNCAKVLVNEHHELNMDV